MGIPAQFNAYVFDFKADEPGKEKTGSLAPPVFHVPKQRDHNPASLGTIRFKLHNQLPRVLDNTVMLNNAVPWGW